MRSSHIGSRKHIKKNAGAAQLRAWRVANGLTYYAAAFQVGVPDKLWKRWEDGVGAPGIWYASVLEDNLQIPLRAWITPASAMKPANDVITTAEAAA